MDFGIHGAQYEIEEENCNEVVKKGLEELDYKKIDDDIAKAYEELKTSNVKIKTSIEDLNITVKDLYKAKYDIKLYDGTVAYKKGDYIPTDLPYGSKFSLCFVDGSIHKTVVDEIVAIFGNDCKYFVNKKNIDAFSKEYDVEAFPMGGQNTSYLDRYAVDALPTKITRFKDKKIILKLNIKRLIREQTSKWELK